MAFRGGGIVDRRVAIRPDPDNPLRLVRLKALTKILGRSTIYLMAKRERFPKPVWLGQRASAWRISDVMAWQSRLSGTS